MGTTARAGRGRSTRRSDAPREGDDGGADGDADDRWSEGWGEASDDGFGDDDPFAAEEEFDAYGRSVDEGPTRAVLDADDELRAAFARLAASRPAALRGLWVSPEMLAVCAPWLTKGEIETLTSAPSAEWTDVDLPSLDAARQRVGDPADEVRRRRARLEAAADRAVMDDVVTHLIAADDGDLRLMSMLRGQDLRHTLDTTAEAPIDPFAGPFAHIVVDEAQELTDAQWQMLVRRNPTRSFTIVGDRAQARPGFAETWQERLRRVGLDHVEVATLTVGYHYARSHVRRRARHPGGAAGCLGAARDPPVRRACGTARRASSTTSSRRGPGARGGCRRRDRGAVVRVARAGALARSRAGEGPRGSTSSCSSTPTGSARVSPVRSTGTWR
ncbi:MAG: hypothetical protein R2692_08310 [Microbacterium sp.]